MYKKIFLAFLVITVVFMAGCKGKRSVKVIVEHPDYWQADLYSGGGISHKYSWHNETYDLGDYQSFVSITAQAINPTDNNSLKITIREDWAAGFLYTAATTVDAESDTTNPTLQVYLDHSFSKNP
jgi:hypothetical protein